MQSETIGALAAALAKAQGDIRPAPMDRDNPFFKSKYATLTSLWESARAALAANGLAVTQATDFDANGHIVLVTTLMHSSGEWVGSVYPVDPADKKPQTLGSALTYARRYAFGALVGLSSEDDDDGNAASNGTAQGGVKATPPTARKEATPTTPPAAATNNQAPATGKPSNGGGAGKSAAFRGFMATGEKAFGNDWNDARHWLIERYTSKETPDNVRESANDLTDAELNAINATMTKYNGKLVAQWEQHKTAKQAELDAINMAGVPELDPVAESINARVVDIGDKVPA